MQLPKTKLELEPKLGPRFAHGPGSTVCLSKTLTEVLCTGVHYCANDSWMGNSSSWFLGVSLTQIAIASSLSSPHCPFGIHPPIAFGPWDLRKAPLPVPLPAPGESILLDT